MAILPFWVPPFLGKPPMAELGGAEPCPVRGLRHAVAAQPWWEPLYVAGQARKTVRRRGRERQIQSTATNICKYL